MRRHWTWQIINLVESKKKYCSTNHNCRIYINFRNIPPCHENLLQTVRRMTAPHRDKTSAQACQKQCSYITVHIMIKQCWRQRPRVQFKPSMTPRKAKISRVAILDNKLFSIRNLINLPYQTFKYFRCRRKEIITNLNIFQRNTNHFYEFNNFLKGTFYILHVMYPLTLHILCKPECRLSTCSYNR